MRCLRQCYSRLGRARQLEQSPGICADLTTELLCRHAASGGDPRESEAHPRRLVSFSAMRHRREIRRVRFHEKAVCGNELKQSVIRPLAEGHDAAEGDVPARGNSRFGERVGAGEAMQHAGHSSGSCFAHHGPGVVLGVPGVDYDGAPELPGKRELFGESAALLEPWRVVVVIIEPALSNGDCAGGEQLSQYGNITGGIEARSVMRVDAGRVWNEPGMARRKRSGGAGGGENISFSAARSDADYRKGPGEAGPFDYLVAVAGERRVGEVRVAVDEVWNAVVLRGHLRSIQRSTGLAT